MTEIHHKIDKPARQIWKDALESGDLKIGSKSLHMLKKYVRREEKHTDGDHVIFAKNWWGNPVMIKAKTKDLCYRDLATLHGRKIIEEK